MSPEFSTQQRPQLDVLREARQQAAEQTSNRALQNQRNSLDKTSHTVGILRTIKPTGRTYDNAFMSADDLVMLDALDVSTHALLEAKEPAVATAGDEKITFEPYADGFSAQFLIGDAPRDVFFGSDKPEDKPQQLSSRVMERYARSPQYQALHIMNETGANASEPFDINSDRIATLALLSDLGIDATTRVDELLKLTDPNMPLESFLQRAVRAPDYKWNVEIDDGVTTLRPNYDKPEPIYTTVVFDIDAGTAQVSLEQNEAYYYSERANQNDANTIPFVETECAEQLLTALDAHGLMLHPKLQREMVAVTDLDDRYGSVYTEMTRTIAKWVNDPQRTNIHQLFVPRDEQFMAETSGYKIHEYDRELVANPEETVASLLAVDTKDMGEPARLLFEMTQQVLTRTDMDMNASQLPVNTNEVQMRNGSCFDVALYYLASAASYGELNRVTVNNVQMLEKTNGAHTFLTIDQMKFNGVTLPSGSLMSRSEEDTWAFLRVTPFAFDNPTDQLATGSEIAKSVRVYSEHARKLGGTTLSHLTRAVR